MSQTSSKTADSVSSLALFDLTLTKDESKVSLLGSVSSMSTFGDDTLTGADRRKKMRRARQKSTKKRSNFRWQSVGTTSSAFARNTLNMPSRKPSNPNLLVHEGENDRPKQSANFRKSQFGLVIPRRKHSNPDLCIHAVEQRCNPQKQRQSMAMPRRKQSNPSLMDIEEEELSGEITIASKGRLPENDISPLASRPNTPARKKSSSITEQGSPKKQHVVLQTSPRPDTFRGASLFSFART